MVVEEAKKISFFGGQYRSGENGSLILLIHLIPI